MRTWRAAVIGRVRHPGRGFTQGLIEQDGTVWESTGLYGASALCRYRLGDERAERSAALPAGLFGEGICRVGDVIWQLTWRERVALRWDAHTLELAGQERYNREGWGICAVGVSVVTSDGTSELVWRDPRTLAPQQVIHVRCAGHRVLGLNDLAWSPSSSAGGTIWANVAGTHYLAGIDPASGEVTDVVNARPAAERHPDPQAIMNGIAALPAASGASGTGEFLLTGKGWQWIRRVRLKPAREGAALRGLLAGFSH
jgi:glutaminyl-peptide cyclotransferase